MKTRRINTGIMAILVLVYIFVIGSLLIQQLYIFPTGWGGWLFTSILAVLLLIGFIAFIRLLRFTLGVKQLEIPEEH